MKKSYGRAAIVLAAISIVAKLIGALYRVPLTNTVGAEGMGLYQMVFPLYTVLLTFCGGGMTSAVSRLVAKYTALGDDASALRVIKSALVPLCVISALSFGVVALLRNVISGLQGNPDAGLAYLALSPSLLFAGAISVLRGYFQGKSVTLPSGISQLVEQVIKLALGLTLSRLLLPRGVAAAVAGALIGVTISEAVAAAYLALRFFIYRRGRKRRAGAPIAETAAAFELTKVPPDDRQLLRELYAFALPVTLGSLVLPVTQMIDSALVINLLIYSGATRERATALFGLFVGPVGTLINMPAVVALSVSVAFLPALTAAAEKGNKERLRYLMRDAAKWIMLFTVPVTLAFLVFPREITAALYTRGLSAEQIDIAAKLLRVQGIGVFYVGVLQLCTTALQGYGKSHVPVVNLLIGACVKVAVTPFAVRYLGIVGASAATAACYAVAATLSARSVYKRAGGISADIARCFLLPIAFALPALAAFYPVYAAAGLGPRWSAVVGGLVFVAIYALVLLPVMRLGKR